MSDRFSSLGLKAGVWQGALRGDAPPGRIALTLNGRTVGLAEVTEDGPQQWRVSATLRKPVRPRS